jgi:hypothetical protein
MMALFKKGGKVIGTAVDIVTDTATDGLSPATDTPLPSLPNVTGEYPASLTDDINLPLLIREMGSRKKLKLSQRRTELLKELEKIDKEMVQLDVLLDAANSL